MMKKLITFLMLPILIGAVSCNGTKETNNLLLAEEVSSTCVIELENENNPEWLKSFDRRKFFEEVFELAIAEKVKVRGGVQIEDTTENNIAYSSDDVKRAIEQYVDTFDINLIKEIRFLEKWDLDSKTLKFTKKTYAWTPIKLWEEKGEIRKQMVFFVYPEKKEKGGLVAQNIIYEHPWYQEYPNLYTGFDQVKFLGRIFDGIKDGTLKVYDPIYLVDKSKRELSLKQLEEYIGSTPNILSDNIFSILFEEDWYFNKETFEITKEVKSFALVKGVYNPEKENLDKKIMFFIIPE